jgi:hypothetical protein
MHFILSGGLEKKLQNALKMSTDSFSTTLLLDVVFITSDGGFRECLWNALSNSLFDNKAFLLRDIAVNQDTVSFTSSSRNTCMSNKIFASSFGTVDNKYQVFTILVFY